MKSHNSLRCSSPDRQRDGFTILELVVSVAIIGILLAIIIPAVQQVREASRRVTCKNNLHQIGVAIHEYESIHGILPPGSFSPKKFSASFSFLVGILPQMEQEAVHTKLMLSSDYESRQWAREFSINAYACPSDSETIQRSPGGSQGANYAGNFGTGVQKFGYNGVFQHTGGSDQRREGPVRFRNIKDGLSNTAMVAEILTSGGSNRRLRILWDTERLAGPDQLEEFAAACAAIKDSDRVGGRGRPWIDGYVSVTYYNHILTPNQPSCLNDGLVQEGAYTATSQHSGGVNVLYADGTVNFISDTIGLEFWRALGSRNGGE